MKIFVFFIAGLLASAALFGAVAFAQSTNAPASQVIGTQNDQMLQQGLTRLNATLGQLRSRMNTSQPPANPGAVSGNLSTIRGTLLSINGTLASLGTTGRTFAQGGTPGLPNTGGGGARYLK